MKVYGLNDGWSLLSYYTTCPEAPDGSGRVLYAAADMRKKKGYVVIADENGAVLDKFGGTPLSGSFWHTGLWQSWSPDCRYVYYQSGSGARPSVTRRELSAGVEVTIEGADMEGAPTGNAKVTSGLLGMLYAAGYGDGHFYPDMAPVPFMRRDRHGLFVYDFDTGSSRLALSVEEIMEIVHDPRLAQWDREQKQKTGDLTTLMAYCLRWSPDGKKCMFHFGNHCVDKKRGEPKIMYILTADADLGNVRLALDLNGARTGVHWAYEPDGEHLVGYGWRDGHPGTMYLSEVRDDGAGYHALSDIVTGGGHPSLHPHRRDLAVTDNFGEKGTIAIVDLNGDTVVWKTFQPQSGGAVVPGRNPSHVDNHPVFSRDGRSLWFNRMENGLSQLVRMELPEEVLER